MNMLQLEFLILTRCDLSSALCLAHMNSFHAVCSHSLRHSTFTLVNTLQLSSDPLFHGPTQVEIHCGGLI